MMASANREAIAVGWCLYKFPGSRNMGEALSAATAQTCIKRTNMGPLPCKRTRPAGHLCMADYLLCLENHCTHTALAASKSPTGLGCLFILHFNHSLRKPTLQPVQIIS